LWLRRFLFVLGGGVLGFVATWIFAFNFNGVPSDTVGVKEVFTKAAPEGGFCGCLAGALLVCYVEKWKHES